MLQIGESVIFTTIDSVAKKNIIQVYNDIMEKEHKQKNKKYMPKYMPIQDLTNVLTALEEKDILFLYKIVSKADLIPNPQKGWGKDVAPGDMSFGGDIERIRQYRNKYVHSSPNAFMESELEREWNDILYLFKRADQYFKEEHNKMTSFHQQAVQLTQPRGMYTIKWDNLYPF